MQAIITKYLCPTNNRGARIKATCAAGSITIAFDHAINLEPNHIRAALALQEKLGRSGKLHTGCIHTGDYVHVSE